MIYANLFSRKTTQIIFFLSNIPTYGIGMSHTAAAVDFMARMILGNYK